MTVPWSPVHPCPRCRALHGCGCAAARERERGTSAERGYGADHQARRAERAEDVAAGIVDCARCHQPIRPGEAWDLGHTDDRSGYTGPEHARCNRAAPRLAAGHSARKGSAPSSPDRDGAFREINTRGFPGVAR